MSQSSSPPPSRRDILSGRVVSRAAREAADAALAGGKNVAPRRPGAYLLHVGRSAMACEFEVLLNAGEHPDGPDAALRALDLVEALEDQLTVYRPHSEVSRLNQQADRTDVVVERRLFELLELALRLHEETQGGFDITAGPLSKVWGFYRRAGRIPTDDELTVASACVGSRYLKLNRDAQSVRFERSGVEINLGGIGKGFALDRCAELLVESGVHNFLIHGGTSSILGRGSRAGLPEDTTGWSVSLRHPLRPERRLAEFWLRDRALGTSGSGSQFFFHQGRRYGHVLDPRSGRPADGVLASTVLAPTAALADALATAFYVIGPDAAARYCAAHPEISALLVTPSGRAGGCHIVRLNLSDADCVIGDPSIAQHDRDDHDEQEDRADRA